LGTDITLEEPRLVKRSALPGLWAMLSLELVTSKSFRIALALRTVGQAGTLNASGEIDTLH